MRLSRKLILILLALLVPVSAQATVSIYPYALDFDANSNRRVVSVRVANTSDEPKTFRVSIVDQIQRENGGFDQVPEDETVPYSAKEFITFSPRQFTLGPKEAQTVNVSRRPVMDLPPGDYVTHFRVQEVPTPTPVVQNEEATGLDVSIRLLYSLVIPVYLKNGEAKGTAEIASAALAGNAKNEPVVNVQMKKSGTKYFRGKISITDGGKVVGEVGNIRIYPDRPERSVSVPINKDAPDLTGREVRIAYIDESNNRVITEKTVRF